MRGRQLRERAMLQVLQRKGAVHEARVVLHRVVPGGEHFEQLVVERQQVDIGDRLAAHDRRARAVECLAALARAADHHHRAAAFEGEQELALHEEERPSRLALAQRIAAPRRALDERELGELGEPLRREPGERRERGKLRGRRTRVGH